MRREITKIIVHCTATPEGRAVTRAEVDRWHRDRGFSCIGYHYLIGLDGRVEAGRPEERVGAHCVGHNTTSIGVCYVGGLARDGKTPKDTRTDAQRVALLTLLSDLRRRYPAARIHGHCEFAAKDCPCFNAKKEYEKL